ncbi:MAG: aminotransferase class I/II-fold pyridoxal phosphate-dependent enzyme [Candidatus Heimdallarchaeota archaeon]|nr:MAG: aminotransferase class I/II-fold pyridoxal phosphate-dependent enzyme [Candidatus Heimdallarchaeota archaeon]
MNQEPVKKNSSYIQKRITNLEREIEKLKKSKSDEDYFRKRSAETLIQRQQQILSSKNQEFNTVSLWGLYGPDDMKMFKSMTLPVFSSPTGAPFDSLLDGALLLSSQTINDPNKIYSRIDNTTIDHLAMKLAALEGKTIDEETQALCLSSGMSAIFLATMPFLEVGDHILSSNQIYGGSEQLFNITYPKMGWTVDWVHEPWSVEAWQEQIIQKTKLLYVETPSNPNLFIANIPTLAKLAHDYNLPLIVDSSVASPALLRPLEHGADIVIHSISKVMGSSGRAIGGAIIAKKNITTSVPDLREDFVNKVKRSHFRNLGPCLHPPSAAAIWDDLVTLQLKIKAMSDNALQIADFLDKHDKIEKVNYPGLSSHPQHDLAKKLMRFEDDSVGFSHLLSFYILGGYDAAVRFVEVINFGVEVADLGRNYTTICHPASTTHGQMTSEMREKMGVSDNLIRYSVGLEGVNDAIRALSKALSIL